MTKASLGCWTEANETTSRPKSAAVAQTANTRPLRSQLGTARTWYPRCISQAGNPLMTGAGTGPESATDQFLGMIANYVQWTRMLLADCSPAPADSGHAVEEAVTTMLARYGRGAGDPQHS